MPRARKTVAVSEEEIVIVTDTPRRTGRKTSPLSAPLRKWEKAHAAADKARVARAKVTVLDDLLASAEADEQAAYSELQDALKHAGIPNV